MTTWNSWVGRRMRDVTVTPQPSWLPVCRCLLGWLSDAKTINPAAGESARTLMTTAFDRYYLQNRRLNWVICMAGCLWMR